MSGIAQVYGREGLTTIGDPQVVELLTRTVEGQTQAVDAFDAQIQGLRTANSAIWELPISALTLLHSHWLAAMLWQMSTCFLDGVVESYQTEDAIPQKAYAQGDALCDYADEAMLHSVQANAESSMGTRPLNAQLAEFPDLKLRLEDFAGVWCACRCVIEQVQDDLAVIEYYGIPSRMQALHQEVVKQLQPQLVVFKQLSKSWEATTTTNNSVQVLKKAVPIAELVFAIGQKLWAPYLLGSVYKEALTRQPTLNELELGFDPWLLTDPLQKEIKQKSNESTQQLTDFWASVANPAVAVQLSNQLEEALRTDHIRRRYGHGYGNIPWQSQFLVRFPVQIGDKTFKPGQLITLYPSDDGNGKYQLEMKGSGRLAQILDLLGQRGKE